MAQLTGLPDRDKYTSTREEILASIMSALGGRVAEELVFNTLSTGAASDFKVATNMARQMICVYGMSEAAWTSHLPGVCLW